MNVNTYVNYNLHFYIKARQRKHRNILNNVLNLLLCYTGYWSSGRSLSWALSCRNVNPWGSINVFRGWNYETNTITCKLQLDEWYNIIWCRFSSESMTNKSERNSSWIAQSEQDETKGCCGYFDVYLIILFELKAHFE